MSDFTIASIFSDHMVLQRNKIISVFGNAANDTIINASLFDTNGLLLTSNSTTAKNDRWLLQLEPIQAQNNCTLKISDNTTEITFSDISIGEVWLAGGQSNMELELQNCSEGPAELQNSSGGKNVRFYYTNKIAWMDEHFYEAEKQTCWQTWDSPAKTAWSAVGYFFARKLAADLNCTIGIIGCNWGGTSASAWMRREFLEKDEDLKTYLTEYEEATKGKSIEQQIKEFDDYEIENQKWQEAYSKLWEKEPGISWEKAEKTLGKNPWPGPKSCKNPYRPTGLYDCMLSRIMPYTLKGFLWYQGESDDHKPASYYKLFRSLIDNWRTDWNDDSLPFVFVQLPVHRYEADPDFKHWCLIREAQAKIHTTVKNTWMTCAFDLGQYSDIHPKAKKVLAERMEANALENVYGVCNFEKGASLSPMLQSALSKDGQLILSFTNAPKGFEYCEDKIRLEEYIKMEEKQAKTVDKAFTGFEVAASDGVFYPAQFSFGTNKNTLNTICLKSDKVNNPVQARYGWFNYGPVSIYKKSDSQDNRLPLCPFRINIVK